MAYVGAPFAWRAPQVQIVPKDAMVTMDHRMDRVRLLVDEATNKIVLPPKRG